MWTPSKGKSGNTELLVILKERNFSEKYCGKDKVPR